MNKTNRGAAACGCRRAGGGEGGDGADGGAWPLPAFACHHPTSSSRIFDIRIHGAGYAPLDTVLNHVSNTYFASA